MKTSSLRQLQHHLSEVMRWVDHGEEVKITRRNRVVARLLPEKTSSEIKVWPDFAERARIAFKSPSGKLPSQIIRDDREERS